MEQDLKGKSETVKFIEENIGCNLFDTGLGYDFLNLTLKAKTTKAKINKQGCIKLKGFCSKETINNLRKHPVKWEIVSAKHIFSKELISKVHRATCLRGLA